MYQKLVLYMQRLKLEEEPAQSERCRLFSEKREKGNPTYVICKPGV